MTLPAVHAWPDVGGHQHTAQASPNLAGWLDLFRWMAAASVLISHLAIRMLAPYTSLPAAARTLPMRGYVFLAGFDHYAVMVFFVLSGFLVGTPVWRTIARTGRYGRPQFTSYAVKRLTRLCTVLWPALCLSGLAVVLARHLTSRIWAPNLDHALAASILGCNMIFLQTAACVQYAQNGALWSLYNEFWYYLAWPPLAVALFARAVRLPVRLLCGVLFVAAFAGLTHFQFTGSAWGPYMVIWLLGVAAGAMNRPLVKDSRVAAGLLVFVLLAIRVLVRRDVAANPAIAYGFDLLVSSVFANLLLTLRHQRMLAAPPGGEVHSRLAGFSFSLYVIHVPALMLYIAVLLRWTGAGWQMAASSATVWAEIAGGLLTGIGAGFALWLLAERHTPALRRRIMARLQAAPAA